MKTVNALLVTSRGEQQVLLTLDESSDGGLAMIVDGVIQAQEDLPAGAYLKVDDPGVADLAVLSGYATEPPRTAKRRRHRNLGRVYGLGLLVGAVLSAYWVVRYLLVLDVPRALLGVALALFLGLLGLVWWFHGEEIGLEEDAQRRRKAAAFWATLKDRLGSGGRKP